MSSGKKKEHTANANLGGDNEDPSVVSAFDSNDDELFASINESGFLQAEPEPPPKRSKLEVDQTKAEGRKEGSQIVQELVRLFTKDYNIKEESHLGNKQELHSSPKRQNADYIKVAEEPKPSTSTSADAAAKRVIVEKEDSNDAFNDGQDSFLCQVADATEDSEELVRAAEEEGWVEEDGVEDANRFRPRFGKPHPLLIPDVLKTIFGFLNCPKTLKSIRRVCKDWSAVAIEFSDSQLTFKNAGHLVQQYPYGLGFSNIEKTFMTPSPTLFITRLKIADPCTVFSKLEVYNFFRALGQHLKYFGFDANFYCNDHFTVLERVLFKYCNNLEELELIGVSNSDFVTQNSGIFHSLLPGRSLTLKKFKLTAGHWHNQPHHHYSSVREDMMGLGFRRIIFDDDDDEDNDGGIISLILKFWPNIVELDLELEGINSNLSFPLAEIWGNPGDDFRFQGDEEQKYNLKTLKVQKLLITEDLDRICDCQFPLKSLSLGKIYYRVPVDAFMGLLLSLTETLEYLEVGDVDVAAGNTELGYRVREYMKINVLRFNVEDLGVLKELVIGNGSRIRVKGMKKCEKLETLKIKCNPIPVQQAAARNYLKKLLCYESVNCSTISFRGCTGICLEHQKIGDCFRKRKQKKLKSWSADCLMSELKDCLRNHYANLELDSLELEIIGQVKQRETLKDFQIAKLGSSIRFFTLINSTNEYLMLELSELEKIFEDYRRLVTLKLNKVFIYEDQAEAVARFLAENVNFTSFEDLTIIRRGVGDINSNSLLWEGKLRFLKVPDNDLDLNLVNVEMRVRTSFHAFPPL